MPAQSRLVSLVSLASTFAAAVVVACATNAGSGIITEPDAATDPADSAPAKADSGTKDSGEKDTSTPVKPRTDAECGTKSAQACFTCCTGFHPAGFQVFQTALQACACSPAGGCATACASTGCQTPPQLPDATCQACLQGAWGTCTAPVMTACEPEPDCAAAYLCFNQCGL